MTKHPQKRTIHFHGAYKDKYQEEPLDAIVVDLPAPLPPESVVTNPSISKVRAKKPFQLTMVND